MTGLQRWSSLWILMILIGCYGCGQGVQLVREGTAGGVVLYVYKGQNGGQLTPRRAEAIEMIQTFCKGPYRLVREGQAKGRSRLVEGLGGSDVIKEQWWGIRFRCGENEQPS